MAESRDNLILPSRWGAGARLAASGLDGDTGGGLVGELLADRIGFRFPMAEERRLWFEVPPGVDVDRQTWTGRALEIRLTPSDAGRIVVGMQDARTMVGAVPGSVRIRTGIGGEADTTPAGAHEDFTALLTRRDGPSREVFSYAYDDVSAEAAARGAEKGLSADPDEVFRASSDWLNSRPAPTLPNPALGELYVKALAVLRQSTLLPEADGAGFSVVAARVRGAARLQVDSVVAADAWARFDPATAAGILLRILASQDGETGLVPGRLESGDTPKVLLSHPPLLSSLAAELGRYPECRDALASVYPRLKQHVRGWILNRPFGSSGVLCWRRASDREPAFEAAMGSSPRFSDDVEEVAGADLNLWILREITALRDLAVELGRADDSELGWFDQAARTVRRAVLEFLWDDDRRCFPDRCRPEPSSTAETSALILPLAAGILPRRHTGCLVDLLRDPAAFGSRMPVPSVAVRDPAFSRGTPWSRRAWCGAVWPHANSWIAVGLGACGRDAEAIELARATLGGILAGYEREGVLFGCYDPEGTTSLRDAGRAAASGAVVDPVLTAAAVVRLSWLVASLEETTPSRAPAARARGVRRPVSTRRRAVGITAGVTAAVAVAVVLSLQRPDRPGPDGQAHAMESAGIGGLEGPDRPGEFSLPVAGPGETGEAATHAATGSDPSPRLSPADVEELVRGGAFEEAADAARRALEDPGAHPAFRYWLASSLWRLGDQSGALDAARALVAEDDERLDPELRTWAERFVGRRPTGTQPDVAPDPRARPEAASAETAGAQDAADPGSGGRRTAASWRDADAAAARLMGFGDWESARAILARQTALYPTEPALWGRLAEALRGAGDAEAADAARATFRRLSAQRTRGPGRDGASPDPG